MAISPDDLQLIKFLRSIINEEITRNLVNSNESNFDIYDHEASIHEMIRDYISNNVAVTLDVI
jgi:hypothetical protein